MFFAWGAGISLGLSCAVIFHCKYGVIVATGKLTEGGKLSETSSLSEIQNTQEKSQSLLATFESDLIKEVAKAELG